MSWIKLVDSFHNEDFVDGDLCEPNMLRTGGWGMEIDFDWGRHQPFAELCSELTGRDGANPMITQADDVQVCGNRSYDTSYSPAFILGRSYQSHAILPTADTAMCAIAHSIDKD